MREIGLGCSKDLADAIKMHERAAARGHGQACYRLGGFYDDGVGVERDPEQALRWYERGRELGDPNATGCCASEATRHFCAVARAETRKRLASRPVWKSKFYGAFVLNRRVVLHAIDATPARWRGDAGSSPLDRARTVHLTHWLISTQVETVGADARGPRHAGTHSDGGSARR
jgi:hypothetical protein